MARRDSRRNGTRPREARTLLSIPDALTDFQREVAQAAVLATIEIERRKIALSPPDKARGPCALTEKLLARSSNSCAFARSMAARSPTAPLRKHHEEAVEDEDTCRLKSVVTDSPPTGASSLRRFAIWRPAALWAGSSPVITGLATDDVWALRKILRPFQMTTSRSQTKQRSWNHGEQFHRHSIPKTAFRQSTGHLQRSRTLVREREIPFAWSRGPVL